MCLCKMEEVCLNRKPLFDEDDEYGEDGGECSFIEYDKETGEGQTKRQPPQPTVGLGFESFDEVCNFYNAYGIKRGFGIGVSNSWFRSKRKECYRAKLSCSSAGFKRKSKAIYPRPETRTGCPAMIVIKLIDAKRWRIAEVELKHNHPLSPDTNRFYKSHKKMILAAKNAQQSEHVMEIHTIKLYKQAALGHLSGGFSETDPRECTH